MNAHMAHGAGYSLAPGFVFEFSCVSTQGFVLALCESFLATTTLANEQRVV
jgi:hypothetical protein